MLRGALAVAAAFPFPVKVTLWVALPDLQHLQAFRVDLGFEAASLRVRAANFIAAVVDLQALDLPALPGCHLPHEREIVKLARQSLSAYANMEELIRIGAYRAGADPQVDRAIALNPALEAFLGQDKDEATSLDDSFNILAHILNGEAA